MLYLQDTASMQIVATTHPNDCLRSLLSSRMAQLGQTEGLELEALAHFIVFEPADTVAALEAELCFSPLQNFVDGSCFGQRDFTPSWEWIEAHECWFELAYVLSDDGFGVIVFLPNDEGVDPELLALCRAHSP